MKAAVKKSVPKKAEFFDDEDSSEEKPAPKGYKVSAVAPKAAQPQRQPEQPKRAPVTSIMGAYKERYDEFKEESSEEAEPVNSDDDDNDGPPTVPKLERALIRTIKQFATFVSSITADLEEKEKETAATLKRKGQLVPASIWEDSTFKIDFTKGLILKVFQPSRLMKYYIIYLLPMKRWITKRQEKFFLRAQVFPGAPEEDIKFFRNLWSIDGTLAQDEKDTIWEYWDTQIEIVEEWQAMTGWVINPNEKLNIPNIDYVKAAQEAGIELSDSDEDDR